MNKSIKNSLYFIFQNAQQVTKQLPILLVADPTDGVGDHLKITAHCSEQLIAGKVGFDGLGVNHFLIGGTYSD